MLCNARMHQFISYLPEAQVVLLHLLSSTIGTALWSPWQHSPVSKWDWCKWRLLSAAYIHRPLLAPWRATAVCPCVVPRTEKRL
jgi:hypothetical protein